MIIIFGLICLRSPNQNLLQYRKEDYHDIKASRFLDPRADVVFKKVFGEHANLLAGFLNAVMPLTSPIVSITYLLSEQAPDIPELKRPIVDVRCEDEDGRTFIVEMQMEWSAAFAKRILYTVSQAYVHQLNRGQSYKQLCPVYSLIFDLSHLRHSAHKPGNLG